MPIQDLGPIIQTDIVVHYKQTFLQYYLQSVFISPHSGVPTIHIGTVCVAHYAYVCICMSNV